MTSLDDKLKSRLNLTEAQLTAFCEKWKIVEFALFGSVLTDEFRPDSDVDVMVTFAKEAKWGLFDVTHMEDELGEKIGRSVDLSERAAVEKSRNQYRRKNILDSSRVIYGS